MSEIVYASKFRGINSRLYESIINAEVYFASPDTLNDPFDCLINLEQSFKIAFKRANPQQKTNLISIQDWIKSEPFFDEIQNKIKELGIWSCSSHGSDPLINPLLWAHYGDEHKGVCLTYELPAWFKTASVDIVGLSPVEYGQDPLVNYFLSLSNQPTPNTKSEMIIELAEKLLTSKDEFWHYENEGRVISKTPGSKFIGKPALKQICFGLRTTNQQKQVLITLLSQLGYSTTFCVVERDPESDFGLVVKDLLP